MGIQAGLLSEFQASEGPPPPKSRPLVSTHTCIKVYLHLEKGRVGGELSAEKDLNFSWRGISP